MSAEGQNPTQIGGFELAGLLPGGSGGQAVLYAARCVEAVFEGLAPGAEVVLKVMHGEARADTDDGRLNRRTQACVALRHPGIVRYYGSFALRETLSTRHVVVMERLRGETLKERVAREPLGMEADLALDICRVCLDALVYAAEQGVLHRDLTPSNIFLCDDGGVKLIDFEVAKTNLGGGQTTTTGIVGKFDYMAPELLRGDAKPCGATDIFSFALCAHEAFSGKYPFDRQGGIGQVRGAAEVDPRLRALVPGLDAVLARALSPDPEKRHPDFRALADDFNRLKLNTWRGTGGRVYQAIQHVGSGGFGSVYKARMTPGNTMVAVKHLLQPQFADRFQREADTLRRFNDGRIVQCVDFFKESSALGDNAFLVMNCLGRMPGSSLHDRLKSARAARGSRAGLETGEALAAFVRFAGGLALLHGEHVWHRDIKPSNLYLPEGEPEKACIMDLGIVRDEGATLTHGKHIPGTPDYMAPEFATLAGGRGSAASDLYALGLCLHEALTGHRAVPRLPREPAKAWQEFVRRALAEPPRPEFAEPVRSDPRLRALLEHMLEPDPAKRLQDAAAVAQKLREISEAPAPDGDAAQTMDVSDARDSEPPRTLATLAAAPGVKPAPAAETEKKSKIAAALAWLKPALGEKRVGRDLRARRTPSNLPLEDDAKRAADLEAQQAAEAETKRAAEMKRIAEAEAEAKRTAEAEAKRAAEMKRVAEAEAEAKRAAEAEAKRAAEMKRVAEAEAEAKRAAEAEEAKRAAEAEAKRAEEAAETKRIAEAEAEAKRAAEAAEAEAQRVAAFKAQQAEEAEVKRKAELEAKQAAEAEAQRVAAFKAQQTAEAEAKRKAELEARQAAKAEAEAKRKAELEAQQAAKAEAEAKRKTELEAKRKAAAEARAKRAAAFSLRVKKYWKAAAVLAVLCALGALGAMNYGRVANRVAASRAAHEEQKRTRRLDAIVEEISGDAATLGNDLQKLESDPSAKPALSLLRAAENALARASTRSLDLPAQGAETQWQLFADATNRLEQIFFKTRELAESQEARARDNACAAYQRGGRAEGEKWEDEWNQWAPLLAEDRQTENAEKITAAKKRCAEIEAQLEQEELARPVPMNIAGMPPGMEARLLREAGKDTDVEVQHGMLVAPGPLRLRFTQPDHLPLEINADAQPKTPLEIAAPRLAETAGLQKLNQLLRDIGAETPWQTLALATTETPELSAANRAEWDAAVETVRRGLAVEKLQTLKDAVAKAAADPKMESWTAAGRLAADPAAMAALPAAEKAEWEQAATAIRRNLGLIREAEESLERRDAFVKKLNALAESLEQNGTGADVEPGPEFEADPEKWEVNAALRNVVDAALARAEKVSQAVADAAEKTPPRERRKKLEDEGLSVLARPDVARLADAAGAGDKLAAARDKLRAGLQTAVIIIVNKSGLAVSLLLDGEKMALENGRAVWRVPGGFGETLFAEASAEDHAPWKQSVAPKADDAENPRLVIGELTPLALVELEKILAEINEASMAEVAALLDGPGFAAVMKNHPPGSAAAQKLAGLENRMDAHCVAFLATARFDAPRPFQTEQQASALPAETPPALRAWIARRELAPEAPQMEKGWKEAAAAYGNLRNGMSRLFREYRLPVEKAAPVRLAQDRAWLDAASVPPPGSHADFIDKAAAVCRQTLNALDGLLEKEYVPNRFDVDLAVVCVETLKRNNAYVRRSSEADAREYERITLPKMEKIVERLRDAREKAAGGK